MRKLSVLFVSSLLLFGSTAYAIELPEGTTPTFFASGTAYSSQYFDSVMRAYGLTFNAESTVPDSYAKIKDGKPVFNAVPTAYEPTGYDQILTAYGLQLTADDAANKLWVSSYAKAKGDAVNLGTNCVAYGGNEWKNILESYSLIPVPEPPQPVAQVADDDGDGVPNDMDACPGTPRYAAVDERGCWALSSAVLFDLNKAVVKPEFSHLLDQTKKVFDSAPKMMVSVDGHADSTGTDSYNQKLSEKRAKAVVRYLVENVGIAADRLSAVGYGESKPAYSNETREGRAKNRRVEFTPAQ